MPTQVSAEIAGNVWKIETRVGADVEAEDVLLILESMKMEIPVEAPCAGRIAELRVAEGDSIEEGAILLVRHRARERERLRALRARSQQSSYPRRSPCSRAHRATTCCYSTSRRGSATRRRRARWRPSCSARSAATSWSASR